MIPEFPPPVPEIQAHGSDCVVEKSDDPTSKEPSPTSAD